MFEALKTALRFSDKHWLRYTSINCFETLTLSSDQRNSEMKLMNGIG